MKMVINKEDMFVEGIKSILKDKTMTQADLSKLSEKPLSTISSWLRNRTKIKKKDQEILAKALGHSVSDVVSKGEYVWWGMEEQDLRDGSKPPEQNKDIVFSKNIASQIVNSIFEYIPEVKDQQEDLISILRDLREIRKIDAKAFLKIKQLIELELEYLQD